MDVSNLPERRVNIVKPSAVFDHLLECNYFIDFGIFDTLAAYASKFNLSIKESFLIKLDRPFSEQCNHSR